MGIYIFNSDILKKYLTEDEADPNSENDFGKNVIPNLLKDGRRMYAYHFSGYWKDVGTIGSLRQANMDVLGSLVTGQEAQIQAINQSLKNIEADLKQLQNSKGQVDTDVNTLRAQIREQIQICNKQLSNLMKDYKKNVRASFRNSGNPELIAATAIACTLTSRHAA